MSRRGTIAAGAALLLGGCLADATLPDDVGDRTPCRVPSDCPSGFTCPAVEGDRPAHCVSSTAVACGNAVRDNFEQCDDGNWIDGDGCRTDCTLETCGDGVVDRGEACDDGGASATCSAECTRVVCGDATVEAPEICDDGNTAGGDGCSSDCLHLEFCGNDLLDPGEACDDGDRESGDGCRADCAKIEVCGDQVVDEGEACDDANDNPSDACHQCTRPVWTARVVTGQGESRGDPLALPLVNPSAAYDRRGRVLVSDGLTRLFRVEAAAPSGPAGDRLVPVAGTGGDGFGGDGAPATGARIDAPSGFDVDDAGRVFVADTGNARVRIIDDDGVMRTLAGTGAAGSSGDGGLAVLAAVVAPTDVALDSEGSLFVADREACRVRKIAGAADPDTAIITTVAGGDCAQPDAIHPGGLAVDDDDAVLIADATRSVVWRLPHGDSGPGDSALEVAAGMPDIVGTLPMPGPSTAVALGRPADVACDGARCYVADSLNHQVYLVVDGVLSWLAGTGVAGFDGDEGPAADALLSGPRRVAAHDGRVLVGDTGNRRLREIDVDGDGAIRTVAGAEPAPRPPHAFGTRVVVDGAGDVLLADSQQAVLWRVRPDGTTSVVAGTGTPGYDGEDRPAVSSRISQVSGLATEPSGGLLLAEPNLARVRRVHADGTLLTIAGNGESFPIAADGASALGALGAVHQVAVDPTTGLVWLSALGQYTIRRINADHTLTTLVGDGYEGFAGDGGRGTLARIGDLTDLTFTDDGVLLFADARNGRVRSYDPGLDRVATVAGTGTTTFNGDGIAATAANLDRPERIAVATDGAILIADRGHHRVRRVDDDGVITTILGDGTASLSGDGGPMSAARVVEPVDLAVDGSPSAAAGDLVLSDADEDRGVLRRVRGGVIDSVNPLFHDGVGPLDRGALATPGAQASLAPVAGDVALFAGGGTGLLERVRFDALAPSGGAIDVVVGRPDGFALGAAAAAGGDPSPVGGEARGAYLDRLGDACGLVFDGVDAVYVADRGAGAITRVRLADVDDPSTWTVALVAGAPGDRRHVDSADGPARLVGPCGLALDPSGASLFVADADDATVRRVELDDGTVTTIFGVPGLPGADTDLLDTPMALAVDVEGGLLVADTFNHRVRRLAVAGDTVVEAVDVLGTGEAASAGDGAPARSFPVEAPRGLAIDPHGNLLVTSTRAVRLVTATVGASGAAIVDGSGAVLTLYGQAPRDTFPQDSTFCLSGVDAPADGRVRVIDACQGFLVELTRTP